MCVLELELEVALDDADVVVSDGVADVFLVVFGAAVVVGASSSSSSTSSLVTAFFGVGSAVGVVVGSGSTGFGDQFWPSITHTHNPTMLTFFHCANGLEPDHSASCFGICGYRSHGSCNLSLYAMGGVR